MADLFGEVPAGSWQAIELPGAEVSLCRGWLDAREADALLAALQAQVAWEVHRIRLFGREVESPRLSCWIGDADAVYRYSRTRFSPRPWTPGLAALRGRIESACGTRFNSVLANLYRDGRDAMGWHSDDEASLGAQPAIASLSLGATRRFRFRERVPQGRTHVLELDHGSLLLMAGDTQRRYRHDLPRTRAGCGPRINLTFRYVQPGG
jgi:alkylated DNA repair dioxygenase AlkB